VTAAVMEPVRTAGGMSRHCGVEVGEDDHPCGAPAVANAIVSCPAGHDESVLLCRPHLVMAMDGGLACYDCDPPSVAHLVAQVRL